MSKAFCVNGFVRILYVGSSVLFILEAFCVKALVSIQCLWCGLCVFKQSCQWIC